MRRNIWNIFVFAVLLTVNFSPSSVFSQGIAQEEESKRIAEYFAEPEKLKLPVTYLQAVMVAYKDFRENIKRYEKESGPFPAFLSNIDNYLITISKRKDDHNYHIWFQPKPFKGELLKGGDAVYIIDHKTFSIIEIKYLR